MMEDTNNSSNLAYEEFGKCWCCGQKVRKSRIEQHHIFGKKESDSVIPLCILCHDLVDRIPIDKEEIFDQYFLNCYNDLIKMGDDYKWTKIFFLKLFKLSYYLIKSKQNQDEST